MGKQQLSSKNGPPFPDQQEARLLVYAPMLHSAARWEAGIDALLEYLEATYAR